MICGSESRHALIFNRRHTQHRFSAEVGAASLPQITHLTVVRRPIGLQGQFGFPEDLFIDHYRLINLFLLFHFSTGPRLVQCTTSTIVGLRVPCQAARSTRTT